MIEAVVGGKCVADLDIVGLEYGSSPKVVTCKGGLLHGDSEPSQRPQEVVLKSTGEGFADLRQTYNDITEEYKDGVVRAVEEFFSFALDVMPKKVNVEDLFGVSRMSVETARKVCVADLKTYLGKALSKVENGDRGKNIEETMFFYPIKGALNALSRKIYEQNK